MPALLAAADVVAVPSLWPENAPFVIREAFAAGRPVLASDTPALRESVSDGVDGRLLPQGDVAAWRAALTPSSRARPRRAGRARRRRARAPRASTRTRASSSRCTPSWRGRTSSAARAPGRGCRRACSPSPSATRASRACRRAS
ncbi:MAG: glycosyltransferase [Planctomycetes bacterium]|nr:glycosyltransferase [Planctomycetota bacterium]